MSTPRASVIVRVKDRAREIERALSALRAQTVPVEIIVVDSGSTDGTLDVAKAHCDRLIEITPEEFTYGRALNLGAAAASAPVHFALSAHCRPERDDWVERSLAHYEREDVAGTGGLGRPGAMDAGAGVVYQDLALLEADPFQGFSSHASSWRASLWERFPFNEEMESAEDREWSWRVLKDGWVIALDPALSVDTGHRTARGLAHWYRLTRRDVRAVASFMPLPAYGARDAFRDWLRVEPQRRSYRLRARVSPWRALALLAKYHGLRDGARVRQGVRAPWRPGDSTV